MTLPNIDLTYSIFNTNIQTPNPNKKENIQKISYKTSERHNQLQQLHRKKEKSYLINI